MKTTEKRMRLGTMLVKAGIITEDQLNEALEKHKKSHKRLGDMLVDLGFAAEKVIISFLSQQLGLPCVNVADIEEIESKVLTVVPRSFASRHKVFPISKDDTVLTVAMADPLDILVLDELRRLSGCEIRPVLASEKEINRAILKFYKGIFDIESIIKDSELEEKVKVVSLEREEDIGVSKLEVEKGGATVVNLVNHILIEAIGVNASDVHIEPLKDSLRIRYRIDGILYSYPSPPKRYHQAIVSRIKVMCSLDLSEHRLPQDGRCRVILADREIDLRVSVTPSSFGEKVVLRILDPSSLCLDLSRLGLDPEALSIFEETIRKPYGIILVTGPTGSGKSTTLYSALNTINSEDRNIITIEDPIEYTLHGTTQVQVKPEIGLTFAKGLRSFLRQDPDVMMVGEIRDRETVEVAIHAALTGHLIFSTLHTNDAAGALVRMMEMGIEPFLISSTVLLCMAQRLVRLVCPKCKEEYTPPKETLESLGLGEEKVFYRGRGCKYCNGIGYKGRIGVFELLPVNEEIQNLVVKKAPSPVIKEAACKAGMVTLQEAAMKKVLEGVTSLEEAFRVIMG
jgi:type IV pilus assembly protein PilB